LKSRSRTTDLCGFTLFRMVTEGLSGFYLCITHKIGLQSTRNAYWILRRYFVQTGKIIIINCPLRIPDRWWIVFMVRIRAYRTQKGNRKNRPAVGLLILKTKILIPHSTIAERKVITEVESKILCVPPKNRSLRHRISREYLKGNCLRKSQDILPVWRKKRCWFLKKSDREDIFFALIIIICFGQSSDHCRWIASCRKTNSIVSSIDTYFNMFFQDFLIVLLGIEKRFTIVGGRIPFCGHFIWKDVDGHFFCSILR